MTEGQKVNTLETLSAKAPHINFHSLTTDYPVPSASSIPQGTTAWAWGTGDEGFGTFLLRTPEGTFLQVNEGDDEIITLGDEDSQEDLIYTEVWDSDRENLLFKAYLNPTNRALFLLSYEDNEDFGSLEYFTSEFVNQYPI